MRKDELIGRAMNAVQCVQGGGPAEDSFIEFKTTFPDVTAPESAVKAARQLAAQANAAAPEPFIWVIGVEEKTGRVQGAEKKELSNWYSRAVKSFDGPPPALALSAILHDFGKPVVAVLFETDDAPYVVKLHNNMDRVVPWREATGQRCASRAELLKLLQNRALLPEVGVIEGGRKTSLIAHGMQNPNAWSVRLHLTLYLENRATKRIVLPAHDCSGWFEAPGLIERTAFTDFRFRVQRKGVSQAAVRDAEEVEVIASVLVRVPQPREAPAAAEVQLKVVGANRPLTVPVELPLRFQRPISLSQLRANKQRRATYL